MVRKRDFLRYILNSIGHDLIQAKKKSSLNKEWYGILRYRLAQYWGSYTGNKQNRKISAALRESYFYPTIKKGNALAMAENKTKSLKQTTMHITDNEKIVALVPMKAHSARVSGKNFRDFAGKPLFRWIIDTLLEVKEIDQIIINTDAKGILKKNGLTESEKILIRDRPKEICGDFVSMNEIIADDISNVHADLYLMTHTTNPLLSAQTIRKAIHDYKMHTSNGNHDSLFTVDRIQTRFYKRDGTPINHNPNKLLRTQDLDPWYEENSNLYIFSAESFAKTKARIGEKPYLYVSPKYESIDIDDPEDWDFAEAYANLNKAKNKQYDQIQVTNKTVTSGGKE